MNTTTIPSTLKTLDREIPILVDSTDELYLKWAAGFIPNLSDSIEVLEATSLRFLRDENLINDSDAPKLFAVLFGGDEDQNGWFYSLMFATEEPVGVIFEGHRPVGTVHAS